MAIGFIFGGDTGETPESLKQKRALAQALITGSSTPKNVGEGLNAIGQALVYRSIMNKADAAQKAGTASANSAFSSISSALAGGSGASSPSTGSIPSPSAQSEIRATAPGGISPSADATDLNGYLSDPARRATLPAGMRNNNPGNIKFVGQKIPGIVGPSTNTDQGDPQAVFDTPESGMRAMYSLLGKKYAGGKTTPNSMIAGDMGWTPGNYQAAANVAKYAGIGPDDDIGFNDPQKAARFMRGLMMQEHGKSSSLYPDSMIMSAIGGQPAQVASTDPAIGMPQTATTRPAPSAAQSGQQVAQALVAPSPQGTADMSTLLSVAQNPFLSDSQKSIVNALIGQNLTRQNAAYEMQLKQQDPAYQLGIRKDQAELANMQTPEQQEATWRARQDYAQKLQEADPLRQAQVAEAQAKADQLLHGAGEVKVVGNQLVRIGRDGAITDVTPKGNASGNGGFRFTGNAVDAQALNGLIDSGQITAEQAQQIAAGKTITGPNGEMLFLTPQSIFAQGGAPQGQQPSQQQGIDIFTGQPTQEPVMQPQGQVPQAAPVPQPQSTPQQQGPIPLTAPKAASEAEKSAAGYADRMSDAQAQLGQFESQGLNGWDQFLTQNRFMPGVVGNSIVGATNPDYQQFDQARRNFINAQLRRESGAVISPEEFDNANKQYFPQPGDSQEVIAQKRQNRERALSSMVRDAGPTYRAPQRAIGKADALAQARDAIAKGAPRDAVIQRLRENGVDPTGL